MTNKDGGSHEGPPCPPVTDAGKSTKPTKLLNLSLLRELRREYEQIARQMAAKLIGVSLTLFFGAHAVSMTVLFRKAILRLSVLCARFGGITNVLG